MSTVMVRLRNSLSPEFARAAGALIFGLLLGTLVAVPYDRTLGLASLPYGAQLYTALQSLVATATLVRVRTVDRATLEVKAAALPAASRYS